MGDLWRSQSQDKTQLKFGNLVDNSQQNSTYTCYVNNKLYDTFTIVHIIPILYNLQNQINLSITFYTLKIKIQIRKTNL